MILKYAGHDATQAYSEVHGPSVLRSGLEADKFQGALDQSTVDEEWSKPPPGAEKKALAKGEKPPLQTLISSHDFELVASQTAAEKTWAFYSSASTDLRTLAANKSSFDRIWFRPRVLKNVREVDTRTKILGSDYSLPLFVSPAAMAKMIHPEGECAIARACAEKKVLHGVCIASLLVNKMDTDCFKGLK